jgi:regulator of PEP synthase PpsR (kinase-PPPase family)
MTLHHLHLVSDSTGETVNSVARACLVQFREIEPREHSWTLVRTKRRLDRVIENVAKNPGPVIYTLVNEDLRSHLVQACRGLGVISVSVLDPVMHALGRHYGQKGAGRPGLQHELDADYFGRIEAVEFALSHDDGQMPGSIDKADVVLVGVSRTSKTPICIYLANRGVKAANVPLVPGVPPPPELLVAKHPLIVGLTKDPTRLVDVRRNRLRLMADSAEVASYADIELVRQEITEARRLYTRQKWPVIDVTRRSIEETAAAVMTLYNRHRQAPEE